jgi:filamentous hemagglutinin
MSVNRSSRTHSVLVTESGCGAEFEWQVIEALSHNGVVKNTTVVEVTLPSGQKVTTISDAWGREAGGLLEIKNVKQLRMTDQLRAQIQLAKETGHPGPDQRCGWQNLSL